MKANRSAQLVALLGAGVLLACVSDWQTAITAAEPVADSARATNKLHMNFRGASLDQVLDYLSEAAGFIINKQTEVRGTVEIWAKEGLTKDEAVQLLNSALKKNGYTAIRSGKMLTIVSAENAKSSDLEVVQGRDPEAVEKSDEVVTQVIPVRFASASQLVNNLQPLLPTSATLSVNESANSLILVATRTEIRRTLKIISALDNSMAKAASIKVIPLQYADGRQLATAIQQLFPVQGTTQTSSAGQGFGPQMFNFPGGPPGFPGGSAQSTSSANSTGNTAGSRVVAIADETSNSLIVSASESILSGIVDMVRKIDRPVSAVTEVRAFRLENADPTELAEQLGQLFPDNTRSSGQSDSAPMFAGGPPGLGGGFGGGGPAGLFGPGGNDDTSGSTRATKTGHVIAVAEPRTRSLLVSAGSALMVQIALVIERLDANPARHETVQVYDLNNADPTQVRQILQDLFNRNLMARNNSQSSSLNNNNDPLLSRQTQQQNGANSGNTGFGTGRGAAGSGGGLGGSGSP
jgi:type II secretory pathway component GspD/PulD (secretin)